MLIVFSEILSRHGQLVSPKRLVAILSTLPDPK